MREKRMIRRTAAMLSLSAFGFCGCSTSGPSPSLTQTDPELATQAHWIAQPANHLVTHDNYDELWAACEATARWRGYRTDRTDYRSGLLVTRPLVSKQAFELWRRDVTDIPEIADSTLSAVRRIVRFEIARQDDGTFQCVPKVLVERFSSSERRITTVTQYRESFSIEEGQGSREKDKGFNVPDTYWYTTGRDESLEDVLAQGVRSRLKDAVAKR